MKFKDYYADLGVARDADLNEIKKAYRKLARQHHPDMSKEPGAEARFKDAAEAYATLKDPDKRAAYDQLGMRPPGEEFAPPPQWQQAEGADGPMFGNLDDMDLAELLASLGRGRSSGKHPMGPMAGRDFETSVRISLEDAHHGATLNLEVGDGASGGGEGSRTLQVTVPAGVAEGQKLRLRGKGGKGRHGGADGDIYLHIHLAPHPVFRADRHDLYFDLVLAPWEAALGGDVEVLTLDAPVLLTVPPLTRAARKLRLRGRGLANGHGGRGDLYAVVVIDVPAALTDEEKKLYQSLAKVSEFNPRKTSIKEKAHEPAAV